jgi:hypothetical protein
MGCCLYVAGGVFIQDVKSGMSIFCIPIERLEMLGFLSHHQTRKYAVMSGTILTFLFKIDHDHKLCQI